MDKNRYIKILQLPAGKLAVPVPQELHRQHQCFLHFSISLCPVGFNCQTFLSNLPSGILFRWIIHLCSSQSIFNIKICLLLAHVIIVEPIPACEAFKQTSMISPQMLVFNCFFHQNLNCEPPKHRQNPLAYKILAESLSLASLFEFLQILTKN